MAASTREICKTLMQSLASVGLLEAVKAKKARVPGTVTASENQNLSVGKNTTGQSWPAKTWFVTRIIQSGFTRKRTPMAT